MLIGLEIILISFICACLCAFALQEKSELETDTYPSLNRDGLETE